MTDQRELLPDNAEETMDLILSADPEDIPSDRWPVELTRHIDLLTALFKRRGRDADSAFEEARAVVLAQALYRGGRPLYFPKGAILESALLHARVWHEFNGRNTHELADRHKLTLRQVQKILKQQGGYRRGLRQQPLFQEEGDHA